MIGVLMCTYNGESYLREQINSILAQEYRDWKLWISDDGSTDGTEEILREYAALYGEQIQIEVHTGEARGACRNFLTMVLEHQNQSDYYMLADQDDVWYEGKMEILLSRMKQAEAKNGRKNPLLVYSDAVVTDEKLDVIAPSFQAYQKMTPSRNRLQQLLIQNNVTGGAMMYNNALAVLLTRVPHKACMHDHWLALMASAWGNILYVEEALYGYRQHETNELGAGKGSFWYEVAARLGFLGETRREMDKKSAASYQALFDQAREFQKLYGEQLSLRQQNILQAFVKLPEQRRCARIRTIFQYGFTFNRWYRTLGECLFL